MEHRVKVRIRLVRGADRHVRAFVVGNGEMPLEILKRANVSSVDVMKQRVAEMYADPAKYELVWEGECI